MSSDGKQFTLFVGDIPKDMKSEDLSRVFFGQCDIEPASIRIISREGRPAYAYANFDKNEDARVVLEKCNLIPPRDAAPPMRIMWKKDPSSGPNDEANLFLRPIPDSIVDRDFYEWLKKISGANVTSLKIPRNKETNKPLGYAFAQCERKDEAVKLKDLINNAEPYADCQIVAVHYIPKEKRMKTNWTNVYVKDFPIDWNDEKLKEEISGGHPEEVTSVVIRHQPPLPGKDAEGIKPFGFVNFRTHAKAEEAVAMNGRTLIQDEKEYTLFVAKSQSKEERKNEKMQKEKEMKFKKQLESKDKVLYITSLPPEVKEELLRKMFESCGEIERITLGRSEGQLNGTAFINFKEKEGATNGMKLNRAQYIDRPITVMLAKTKSDRAHDREAKHQKSQAPAFNQPFMTAPQFQYARRGQYPAYPPSRRTQIGAQMQPHMAGQMMPQMMGPMGQMISSIPPHMQQRQEPAPVHPAQPPLPSLEEIKSHGNDGKNIIGEYLYRKISTSNKEDAGKLTGMLLEMDIEDLYEIASDNDKLHDTVDQALKVLKEFQPDKH